MNPSNRILSSLDRVYRSLLNAYPVQFREKYGPGMAQVFRDRCREEVTRQGNWGLINLSLHTLFDLILTVTTEHMDILTQDVGFGSRMLIESPGFTATAVLTLALGIGANSAVFSAISAALLPSPYKDADRLVFLSEFAGNVSPAKFEVLGKQNQIFEELAPCSWDGINLTGEGKPEYLIRARVSANFFPLLGVKAALGRAFLSEEDQPGVKPVALVSHDFWERRFHSDPNLIGKSLTLDGESTKVVGVVSPNFHHPGNEAVALWTPIVLGSLSEQERSEARIQVMARLRPGVSPETANADIKRIFQSRGQQISEDTLYKGWHVQPLSSLRENLFRNAGPVLMILQVCVVFMLLLACANVAGLLLARAATRQTEMSIRTTLGASRQRLIRQLFTESMLLALMGGALGLLLAWGITHLMASALSSVSSNSPQIFFGLKGVGINGRVLGFTLLITLLTGMVFGLTPAFRGSRAAPQESLQPRGWHWSPKFTRQNIHSLLVVVEVAVALAILMWAALAVQKFFEPEEASGPRLDAAHVLTLEVRLPESQYPERQQIASVYRQILHNIESLPQVQSVGMGNRDPWYDSSHPAFSNFVGVARERDTLAVPPKALTTWCRTVSASLLPTLRIPLKTGRYFAKEASGESPPEMMITSSMAQYFFPREEPIGKRIKIVYLPNDLKFWDLTPKMFHYRDQKIAESPGQWYSIVGVVENSIPLAGANFFVPYSQAPENSTPALRSVSLLVRTNSDPMKLSSEVSNAIWTVDKDLPVSQISTLEQRLSRWIAPERFLRQLFAFFSGAAMALAVIGIYGLMTYVTGLRTREIGVRLSLGARSTDVLRLVMSQGLKLIGIGMVLGLVVAMTLPIFFGIVYEFITVNPSTFSGNLSPQRLMFLVLGILAGAALALAASEIYSLRTDSDSLFRREQGVSHASGMFRGLVGKASKLTVTGVLAGLLFTSFLFGVFMSIEGERLTHMPTFAGASLLLATVALLACYLTARKATRVDPSEALRSE